MSDYDYRLVAIKPEHKEIFECMFNSGQEPSWFLDYKGGVNEFAPEWNEELYQKYETDKDRDNPIVTFVEKETVELEYFTLYSSWYADPFEYEWWIEIKEYFRKNGPLIKIDKQLKEHIKGIMSYEDKKLATASYMMMEIYEFIIDNWGGFCYHYVY